MPAPSMKSTELHALFGTARVEKLDNFGSGSGRGILDAGRC